MLVLFAGPILRTLASIPAIKLLRVTGWQATLDIVDIDSFIKYFPGGGHPRPGLSASAKISDGIMPDRGTAIYLL